MVDNTKVTIHCSGRYQGGLKRGQPNADSELMAAAVVCSLEVNCGLRLLRGKGQGDKCFRLLIVGVLSYPGPSIDMVCCHHCCDRFDLATIRHNESMFSFSRPSRDVGLLISLALLTAASLMLQSLLMVGAVS